MAAPALVTGLFLDLKSGLAPAERRYLAEILWGFLERDYEKVAQTHFDAGYVPRTASLPAFAQALRAVGEPVFGRAGSDVSMSRVLTQLFAITALFDMRLQPQLVLLQKTMMTVEGVARRIDPEHDIWRAADPVVRRWMLRELGPVAQAKRFADEGLEALRNLVRLLENPPQPTAVAMVTEEKGSPFAWFAVGAAVSGLTFLLAAWLF